MKKKTLLLLLTLLLPLWVAAQNAGDMTKFLPNDHDGWKNLTYGVADSTQWGSNSQQLEVQIVGSTIHVAWMEHEKQNNGKWPLYYRRSTDYGKTWEKTQVIAYNESSDWASSSSSDAISGCNSHWMTVEGQNVHFAIPLWLENGKHNFNYIYSRDGGKTFTTKKLWETDKSYVYPSRPHVVCDGKNVVLAMNNDRTEPHVWTSTDGGDTFKETVIDKKFKIVDLQVSGKRWTILGFRDSGDAYDRWSEVYFSTSADGGQTVSTENLAHKATNGKTYSTVSTLSGGNRASYDYHPQLVQQGDIIDLIYVGSLSDGNTGDPDPGYDKGHTIHRRSTDGGKTWSEAKYIPESTGSDGTLAAKGNNVYVYTHWNGAHHVYHSHDGGKTWEVNHQAAWSRNEYNQYYDYALVIAPDDPTGQHAYLTGERSFYAETRDGFRTLSRNFSIGYEAWNGVDHNNHGLRVLVDDKGTEHWFMHYRPPYQGFEKYFWTICYRRNDPVAATGSTNMALKVTDKPDEYNNKRPRHNVTVPMTNTLHEIKKATTVECWVRADTMQTFQIASLTHNDYNSYGSPYRGGWFIRMSKGGFNDDLYHYVEVCLTTEKSVDGVGTHYYDSNRYRMNRGDLGLWHHIAFTYDSSVESDNFRIYADGMLIGLRTMQGDILQGNNGIVLGNVDNNNAYSYSDLGLIDNFAVWDRALTEEELRSHIYNAPTGKENGCRLLLTFDGSLQDKSNYHNDAIALQDLELTAHNGIRPPHPEFIAAKTMGGKTISLSDVTKDGETAWWVMSDAWYLDRFWYDKYVTSTASSFQKDYSDIGTRSFNGTYTYYLVSKGTGNCNAYASTMQQVTFGGLNKVEPSVVGKSDNMMIRIYGGYELTNSRKPYVAIKQGDTVIEGAWDLPPNYNHSKVFDAEDMAMAMFDMTHKPTGKYDVIVGTDTLYQALQVDAGEVADVWCNLSGNNKMLVGKWKSFNIDYGNRSNTAAYNVPFFLFIDDKEGNLDVSFDFEILPYSDALSDEAIAAINNLSNKGEYFIAEDEQGRSTGMRCYSFNIPYIAPNSENHRTFRMCLNANYQGDKEVKLIAIACEPLGAFDPDYDTSTFRAPAHDWDEEDKETLKELYGDRPTWGKCVMEFLAWGVIGESISVIPFVGCFYNTLKTAYYFMHGDRGSKYRWLNLGLNAGGMLLSCASDAFPPTLLAKCGVAVVSMAYNLIANSQSVKQCMEGKPIEKKVLAVFSYDPNEMIGPWGFDDNAHYIQPIHQMPYTITFENKSSASAPAHEVFVNDTLDASRYDFSTFNFSSFGWADVNVTLNEWSCRDFTRDVNYKVKGKDIIVRVSGQFDEKTGVAKWSFISLDKDGNEIDDPDLGFLVPNNDNLDGEGFVGFTVNHKNGLATKTRISNKATIIFDANAPIVTNTYVNTIDTDYPTSKVTQLVEKDNQVTVSFEGSDATSGIAYYSVYAMKNGGEPELVASRVTDNKVTVDVEGGTQYGFFVIATDNVGWNEPKDAKAEKVITTSGTAHTATVTVAEAGYATFYDSQFNYVVPTGLKASVVSGYSNSRLSYQSLSNGIIPKGVAVLLEASSKKAATFTLTSTNETVSYSGDNMLHGSDETTTTKADGDALFYKLAYGPSGTSLATSFGWFWGAQNGAAFRIDGHRAWLAIPKKAAAPAYILSGSETGIDEILSIPQDGVFYDLQGRPMVQPLPPGIYIQGNRKIVINKK